jgi:pimeloyl-ACP methyl ester carboxylesterase
MARVVVILGFAAALVVACHSGSAPGSFQPAACPVPNYPGVPSANLGPEFSCGYLTVPENRSVPNGRTIRILVVRAKAASATPKPDPIVFLHGGPGGIASIEAPGIVAGGMNAEREVIFVNQRSGLHDEPHLACPELDAFDAQAVELVYQDRATAALDSAAIAACRNRLAATGANLLAFGTLANAADFADLRVALGIEQWNVYGVSYGADLAQQLARDHPEGIRTLILDSVLPPTVNIVDKWWEAPASGLKAIFKACADQPACAASYPDLETVFNATVNKLAQTPAHVTVTGASGKPIQVTIDGFKLVPLILDWSANDKVVDIPRMIYNIAYGDGTIAAGAIAVAADEKPADQQGLVGTGLALDSYCQDMANWTTPQRALAHAKLAIPAFPDSVLQIAPTGSYIFHECAAWDTNRSNPITHAPVVSAIPTLILSGTFDSKASPSWISESMRGFRNSVVVHIPGSGHAVLPRSKCGQSIMSSFVDNPTASVDTSCVAQVAIPRFTVPAP